MQRALLNEPGPGEFCLHGGHGPAGAASSLVAQIVFNRPMDAVYTYLVPEHLRELVGPGQRVRAPFGKANRRAVGYCVGTGPADETGRSLKSIEAVLDREPLLSETMLQLTRWIADHYLCSWGQVLDTVVPAGVRHNAGTRLVKLVEAAPDAAERLVEAKLPEKQRAVLRVLLDDHGPLRFDELIKKADCGPGPVKALCTKGLVVETSQRSEEFTPETSAVEKHGDLELTGQQRAAFLSIVAAMRSGEHRTLLLHGVTGSGKTEVYTQAIREVVHCGRQAIVLVPEISLTPQTIRHFRSRFDSVAVLHSHQTDSERHWHWQRIARGEVQVVVGARSAIFAPTPKLGLIVIDEEHETSFKQDTVPRYHAREVARRRAELEGVPLVLGSATPTLESWRRAQQNLDILLSLPKRIEQRPLPPVVIVDVRNDPQCRPGGAIGVALQRAMQKTLAEGGQVILFLNLRGYSPTLWCRSCGYVIKCPHCDITLTYHKGRNVSLCHSCGHEAAILRCPGCGRGGISYLGNGTERLEKEVRTKFPDYPCLRMDSDSMRRPGSHDAALDAFRKQEVRILLGTQMIAKGLDFPNVTLVGVISADTALHQPDFRSGERTFQLIAQVAGRTGRGERTGRVYVQTTSPTESAIRRASEHDYLGFAAEELQRRHELMLPPYQTLVRVIVRGPEEEAVRHHSDEMVEVVKAVAHATASTVRVLGPGPAPVAKIKDNYRYHFQLSGDDFESIRDLWRHSLPKLPKTRDVEFAVDVDPMNMR
ncbi:MAG: primosomal protein N' [Pirellulales bacterium]|nr:primosomal protein N' [Pirellulales bacterium]